jgi:hypothetical protein
MSGRKAHLFARYDLKMGFNIGCKIIFLVSLEEENLFFQKSYWLNLGCFSGLGLGMALGRVEKCRNMSTNVDSF